MESLAPLPNRRCPGCGRTSRAANVTLTTDSGNQFTSSRFLGTLGRLGITHRRTEYYHPEGNSYIERFYRSLEEARASIRRWIEEYNHDRPHHGVGNRTPYETFLSFAVDLKNEALTIQYRGCPKPCETGLSVVGSITADQAS